MKPSTRPRSGQPRDQVGRFTRGGSLVGASGSVQNMQRLPDADPVVPVAVNLEQRDSSEDDEVSGHGLEGNGSDSSSAGSNYDKEEVGKPMEQQGLSSSQSGIVGDSVAQQVFAEMPHTVQVAAGGNLGIDSSARVPEKGVGGVPKAPWVNLFKDNRNLGMGLKLDEWEVDGDLVMLEEDDVDVVEETWGYCLVGLFAGKFPGWTAVRKLREGWKVNCTHWRHRSGWFVFKFQSDEDRRKVLEGGPYFAYGSNLILKSMPRCFRFEGEDVSSVPIWIKLPGLPLDCWNARALGKIVSKVGKPISTDKLTPSKERISFARVLVEVDASKDIISEVEVRLPTGEVYQQLVIPELIPKFCKRCKSFGHVEGGCAKGSEGTKGKVIDDKRTRTGGGSVNCSGANKEGSGPLDDVPHIQMAPASGSGDCGDVIGSKELQDWILSGPMVVQDVSRATQNMVPGPVRDRAKEVICAIARALQFELEIEDVPYSVDPVDGGDGGADLLPVKPGLTADPASKCPEVSMYAGPNVGAVLDSSSLCPVVDLLSIVGDKSGVGIREKNKTKPALSELGDGRQHADAGGVRSAPAVAGQASRNHRPDDGLDGSAVGWNVVGKKGKRKK